MMVTLGNSSSKYRNTHGGFSTTNHTFPTPQIRSLLLPFKHLTLTFSLAHRTTHLITPISSQDKQGQETKNIDESKTVRVKFQLERECSFGQHFFLVGNDLMLGLWNPLNALQLNWSDGHIWTVELDVPIGKSIKFKFLLKGDSEEDVLWQPGPDRILQTWETEKVIRVCEDWENADLQKLVEEEESSCSKIDASVMATLVENLAEPIEKEDEAFALGVNGKAMNAKDLDSKENEGIMGSYKGVPVLVPGLTPLPTAYTDREGSMNNIETNLSSKVLNVPQMQGVVTDSKETTTMVMTGDKEEPSQEEEAEEMQIAEPQDRAITTPVNNDVLENNIQWGRQTLQKFLSNFGIL